MTEVRALTPADEPAYTAFLEGRPDALLYHSLPYRDLLVEHLGCEAEYLLALDGGEIRGVLPTMTRDGVLNALPFYGSHGGPVGEPEALLAAWDERAGEARAATLVTNPFGPPHRAPLHDATDVRLNQAVPLLLARTEPSAARNVRKAQRLGVEVAIENDQLPALAAIHAENMERVGAPPKEPAFFAAIPRHFSDFAVYTARLDGELVAGLLLFRTGAAAVYFTPAIAHAHRSAQPLAAVLARAIADASRDFAWFDFGGTYVTNDNLRRFKRKWGARDVEYTYFTKVNDRALLAASPAELRAQFGDFYVAPYALLEEAPTWRS